MKISLNAALLVGCIGLSGCFSLTYQGPELPAGPSAQTLQKQTAKKTRHRTQTLPQTLGGMLQSDSWIVYPEKQEEEFKGNVFYDNDTYIFRADYALSQRAKNLFTARGNVYIRKNEPDGAWYELYAEQAVYNYKTGKGQAQAAGQKPVRLVYHTAKDDTLRARAKRADINTQEQTAQLSGRAVVIHTDPQNQTNTLQADRISVRQKDQYALLQGHAEAYNSQYHLWADRIEYEGTVQTAVASGGRPLARGTTENGTFAIIADKVTAHPAGRQVELDGQVQGWIVSEQLETAEKNAGKKK